MSLEKQNQNVRKGGRTVERLLLSAILLMQLVIAWGIFTNQDRRDLPDASPEQPPLAEADGVDDAARSVLAPGRPRTMQFVRHDPFEHMDVLFADALGNMARLRSALHIDEGWDSLGASPTMDMRDDEGDYVVSFSLPQVRPSDIDVSLDGRVLTVQALAPVAGPGFRRMQRFQQRVLLPGPVANVDDAHASVTNGVLSVHIPKSTDGEVQAGSARLF